MLVVDGCKVIKKRKTEEIEQTTETKMDAKMIKTEGKIKARVNLESISKSYS